MEQVQYDISFELAELIHWAGSDINIFDTTRSSINNWQILVNMLALQTKEAVEFVTLIYFCRSFSFEKSLQTLVTCISWKFLTAPLKLKTPYSLFVWTTVAW